MLTVNLFDDSFRHAICSTGWKTPRHVQYVRDRMEFDGITLFTDGYVNSPIVEQVKSRYKIGWLREPECLHPENYKIERIKPLDFILTYYEPLLMTKSLRRQIPFNRQYGCRFAPYGGVWIPRDQWGLHPKTKLCSMLYGSKLATEGHRIRHEIANAVRPLGVVDFYGYEGQPVDYSSETKVKVLKDYAFTIVTETCMQDNLFTEILLDCFAMGTVPIFWGCPNVGEFFDSFSIYRFERVEQIAPIVMSRLVSFDYYYSDLVQMGIASNLNQAVGYEIAEDWLYQNVLRELV